jgi:hypothetical protein
MPDSAQLKWGLEKAAAAASIDAFPPRKNSGYYRTCRYDLHKFLAKIFPSSTGLKPFSDDQITAIHNLESAILKGGRLCQALPRGFAKTSIAVRAALWAVLYGHRQYVAIYCSNATAAEKIVEGMKQELEANPLLLGMFPKAIYPIRHLDGKHQKTKSQNYQGVLTKIDWKASLVSLPTVKGSESSGSVLEAKAVNAARGSQRTTSDGRVLRPDFIILDDPQTDADAQQPATVRKIVSTLKRSALRGGGQRRCRAFLERSGMARRAV